MPGEDEAYVIAVKRAKRSEVPPDWVEIVRDTPGVVLLGGDSPARIQVKASLEAIEQLRGRLAEYVHIEKCLPHARY